MSKENSHFDDQSKEVVFFISSRNFLKEIENMFFVFLSSCKNICETITIDITIVIIIIIIIVIYLFIVLFLGASTLVGIGMTALSKSEIFQIFFKMFFSMIFLGLLHGLCILPVHLSIFHRLTTFTHANKSGTLRDGHDVGDSCLKEGNINPGIEVETELHDNHIEQSADTIALKTEGLNGAHLKGRIILINYRESLK